MKVQDVTSYALGSIDSHPLPRDVPTLRRKPDVEAARGSIPLWTILLVRRCCLIREWTRSII